MELVNRICPNCKNPNYMVLLGDFSTAYKYKCMNCNGYFNDIDFEKDMVDCSDELAREIRKMRKSWEQAVNKAMADDKESKIVIDSRKRLFMGLFDDFVNEKLRQEDR